MNKYDLDDEIDPNRWLISYADFITLLFAFFVVMYAISSVNEGKYKILSSSLHQAFDLDARSLQQISVGEPAMAASPHVVDIPDSMGFADAEPGNSFLQTPDSADDLINQIAGFIDERLGQISHDNDWIEINLQASQLFSSNRATLTKEARMKLTATAEFLAGFDSPISIEGYTDNIPSNGGEFESNWELSSARASSVAKFLEDHGVDASRLSATGYAENYPLETNATPGGRQANRRVALMVARKNNVPSTPNPVERQRSFVYVRRSSSIETTPVISTRTESGGLLFTNEPNLMDQIKLSN